MAMFIGTVDFKGRTIHFGVYANDIARANWMCKVWRKAKMSNAVITSRVNSFPAKVTDVFDADLDYKEALYLFNGDESDPRLHDGFSQ